MYLIVGLGNPGKKYEMTRHNIGYLLLDKLAKDNDLTFKKKTSVEAEIAEGNIDETRVILCKPQTFMNASGRSVGKIVKKNGLDAADVLVINDDADLELGDIRVKIGGSSAGHNGVQSVTDAFPKGTAIARIRVGIGRPSHSDIQLEDFVLQKFSKQEQNLLDKILEDASQKVMEVIRQTS
jgi:peptidyl-tRNA hydrolase, PTH1 family